MDVYELYGSLWSALNKVEELLEKIITPDKGSVLSLTPIQWFILCELYNKDRQHASVLAKSVGRPATSFTPILDKLQNEPHGLIERQPDPNDRRAVFICLTEKGHDRRAKTMKEAAAFRVRVKSIFSAKDVALLESLLSQVDFDETGTKK